MTDFDRYSPAICFFHLGAALVAVSFGWVVLWNGTPVTPELYGEAVYEVPALVWVAIQLVGALTAASGAAVGGRGGAWVCLLGATITALLFSAFAVMGANAGATGTLLVAGCAFVMAPSAVASALLSIQYLRGRNGQ